MTGLCILTWYGTEWFQSISCGKPDTQRQPQTCIVPEFDGNWITIEETLRVSHSYEWFMHGGYVAVVTFRKKKLLVQVYDWLISSRVWLSWWIWASDLTFTFKIGLIQEKRCQATYIKSENYLNQFRPLTKSNWILVESNRTRLESSRYHHLPLFKGNYLRNHSCNFLKTK